MQTNNGDGTVPVASAWLQFAADKRVQQHVLDNVTHLSIMDAVAAQKAMLASLGIDPRRVTIVTGGQTPKVDSLVFVAKVVTKALVRFDPVEGS